MDLHKFEKMLPELNLIKNQDLKEKVIVVWERAITEGGWELADLENIPFTLLLENCDINLLTHTSAVTRLCEYVGKLYNEKYGDRLRLNMDYLLAGGLLHDVGKLIEYTKKEGKVIKSQDGKLHRHPFTGASLAREAGLPPEVIHIIYAHSKEGDLGQRLPEAIIVHHADFMNFEPLQSVYKHK